MSEVITENIQDLASGLPIGEGYRIDEILQAAGWRFFYATFNDGKPYVGEYPMIGFAKVARISKVPGCLKQISIQVEPLLWEGEYSLLASELRIFFRTGHEATTLVPPGMDIGQDKREALIEEARDAIAFGLNDGLADEEWWRSEYEDMRSMVHNRISIPSFEDWVDLTRDRLRKQLDGDGTAYATALEELKEIEGQRNAVANKA